jgi:hypothetical protein
MKGNIEWENVGIHTKCWCWNLIENSQLRDVGGDGSIIVIWISGRHIFMASGWNWHVHRFGFNSLKPKLL